MSASGIGAAAPAVPAASRAAPFGLRVAALAAMGAIFFSTYGFANWLASRHASVPSFAFGWERAIPFLPWTIVPYWSIDLLYGFSFAFQTNRAALAGHVKRLLFVQLVSVACFIAWPLRFGFERPEAGGLAGALFTALAGFDKPFNQAPSLHIGLLVVLWAAYAARWREGWQRALMHPWFAAIGVSVLTTYQHHAIDVPTGAAVGCLALFLFPLDALDVAHPSPRARRIGTIYAVAALLAALVALACIPNAVPGALLAGWIALALAATAFAYLRGAPAAFQKRADGRIPLPVAMLLAPTIAGAFVNSRIWTRRAPRPVEIAPRVL
uniref:phosphatase PAP2 family protein n=1 Tax=Burkholderia sp. Ac-20379 TaxID=2703900 RepID=UPI001980E4EE|nr:inositol phosphorylceramide synthase [Burkholderia sp. Ac-20379]